MGHNLLKSCYLIGIKVDISPDQPAIGWLGRSEVTSQGCPGVVSSPLHQGLQLLHVLCLHVDWLVGDDPGH